MSQPYIGEIRLVGFNFAPYGYAFCNGATMSISQNNALYNLIGTTYGGNGTTTFNLPDLQGRVPIHQGNATYGTTYVIGQKSGSEAITLTFQQIPQHNHTVTVQPALGTLNAPAGNYLAGSSDGQYALTGSGQTSPILSITGQNQPHENRQPFQAINYIIAIAGIYPTQS